MKQEEGKDEQTPEEQSIIGLEAEAREARREFKDQMQAIDGMVLSGEAAFMAEMKHQHVVLEQELRAMQASLSQLESAYEEAAKEQQRQQEAVRSREMVGFVARVTHVCMFFSRATTRVLNTRMH